MSLLKLLLTVNALFVDRPEASSILEIDGGLLINIVSVPHFF